ncbi:MAG: porphobilinogen synthase [Candidatus Nitrosocosmicus sp.]
MDSFIFPIFVYESKLIYENSLSLGYLNDSKVFVKDLPFFIQKLVDLKIYNILIFGIPRKRNFVGSSAFYKKGIAQRAIRIIKENFGKKINVISDVCVCQYNTSGHCGVSINSALNRSYSHNLSDRVIENDKTLRILGKISLSLSESGTDFVAPSSMMDGQVLYIKKILEDNDFDNVKILGYSSKHNSCLYSPFRNNNFFKNDIIDKSSYQNSFNNLRESIRETLFDIDEGADWIMIKPSLWYMDIVKIIREYTEKPLVVQNVSGEYSLIKAAAEKKWINEIEWVVLYLLSLKRAGADKIISYFVFKLLDANASL